MTRPWHRSRLFWFGLLGLTFLLWAWTISNFKAAKASLNASHIILSNKGRLFWCHTLTHQPLTLVFTPDGGFIFFLHPPWDITITDVPPADRRWLPVPRFAWAPLQLETTRYISLPYWLITTLYLATWLPTLAWWQCRKSRTLTFTTGDSPRLSPP